MPKKRLPKRIHQVTLDEVLQASKELMAQRARDKGPLKALHWVPPMSKVALHLRTTTHHVRKVVLQHQLNQEKPQPARLWPRPEDLWKSWGLSWSQIMKMI